MKAKIKKFQDKLLNKQTKTWNISYIQKNVYI